MMKEVYHRKASMSCIAFVQKNINPMSKAIVNFGEGISSFKVHSINGHTLLRKADTMPGNDVEILLAKKTSNFNVKL